MQRDEGLSICHIVSGISPAAGGTNVVIIELLQFINQDPYCKRQFLIAPKANEDTTEFDKSFDFEVFRANYWRWLPITRLRMLSFGLFALKRILWLNRKYGIDVLQAHGVTEGVAATIAGKILRKPVVWYIHGVIESSYKLSYKLDSALTRIFKPDHVLAGRELKKFAGLVGGDKLTGIYGGLDTQKFYPKPANKELLNNHRLESKFIISSIQRLVPIKGLEYALLAFEELLRKRSLQDAVLLLIGDGVLREQLEKLASELGIADAVLFLGEIPNSKIPDYLSISDIVLATSTHDNDNCSTREALACGKAVVAFNSGKTHDLIKHMETGLLAESGDVQDLADKVLMLYQNPELRTKTGKNGRRFIEQNRSWGSREQTELQVYRRLIRARRKQKPTTPSP